MSQHPHFGHTRAGLPVHAHVIDHLKGGNFNKRIAVGLTGKVGTMRTFWYFNVLSLLSLPATLVLVGVFAAPAHGPLHFFLTFGWIYLITWICQNYIQLVLLPALMVGQNLQNEASDARAAKQFEDQEVVKDWLDLQTKGGLTEVHQEVISAREDLHAFTAAVSALAGAKPAAGYVAVPAAAASPAAAPGSRADFEQRLREFMHNHPDDLNQLLADLGYKPPARKPGGGRA